MPALRRSGGVTVSFWHGELPDPNEPAFAQAMARRRFRTIENAASEEVSVGWVTPGDPTGGHIAAADFAAGPGSWLRMRIDKKALPRPWLAIHRAAAERAKGRKLSARERRELKDDLHEKLLPRVLPTVNLVDALLYRDQRTVLLFATGKTVRESFGKLFFETFALPLDRCDPLTLGQRTLRDRDLRAALERAEAVRWPRRQGAGDARRAVTRDQEAEA